MNGHPVYQLEELWINDKKEREKHMEAILSKLVDKFTNIKFNCVKEPEEPEKRKKEDKILKYSIQFLTIGSIYLEFTDSVKEGDGERLIRILEILNDYFP